VLIGRHDDPTARTRVDVDVRVHAALTDEPQGVEVFEQPRTDLCALADQNEDLGVLQTRSEGVGILDMIVPYRNLVPVQFAKALESTKRVEIIVENRNIHEKWPPKARTPSLQCIDH
jgi:hypothetical protein